MSESLIGYKFNEQIYDLISAKEEGIVDTNPVYMDSSDEATHILRHTCAHLMAEAITSLYTNAKFFVGPVIENGFYYDFKVDEKIGEEDLSKIEKRMKEIAKVNKKIEKYYLSREEIEKKFSNDELKQAVLSNIDSDKLSIYTQGNFEDLCRGPHLPNMKLARNFKLTKLAGAYLGGNEKNEMITRIYGVAFGSKEELNKHLKMLEDAKKRDHRKVGKELEYFMFDDTIGAGLPLWLPRGARLREKIEGLLGKALRNMNYFPVKGPEILKSQAWKTSGHYDNYGENMYFTEIDDAEYGLKPMNCVGHVKIYGNSINSYRDLPLRFYEYGVVHRHEKSGVLHGLLRVREFTQDDAHIFCRKDQVEEEVLSIFDFIDSLFSKLGFKYKAMLSTKPEKSIGSEEFWSVATEGLKKALVRKGVSFEVDEGGGAFYGPKIDIKILDSIGREWQLSTIQVDYNLPERFNLSYIDEKGSKERPIMIHRAILGSFERFIAILIEHTAGEIPLFLSPTQVVIVPVSSSHTEYAKNLQRELRIIDVDSEVIDKNETLNKKIRLAESYKPPYVVIVGDKELESETLSIRDRISKNQFEIKKDEFVDKIEKDIKSIEF